MNKDVFEKIKGKLIVSCQALPGEPLHSPYIMSKMALAAAMAGAAGIRANTTADITEIKKETDLPLIGIIKEVYKDSEVYITPTLKEVDALVERGVDIIAMDATSRLRTGGASLEEIFTQVRKKYPNQLFMADCSTVEEGLNSQRLGFDCVGTTLSGYTSYTVGTSLPDTDMIRTLSKQLSIPVIAEGGIHSPEELREALDAGAWAAVVGGAITRPLEIAKRFIAVL